MPSLDSLDSIIATALAEHRIVGTIIIAAHRGEVIYRRAHGLADREANLAMQPDHVLRLASLTKPLVAAATLRLIERGTLALDQPVTTWLPAFRPRLADGSAPPITIHQLLTHTSGLGYKFSDPRGPYHALGVSDGMDASGLTLDDNLRRLAAAPLHAAPGSAWQYSLSLDVLGRVIEVATEDTLGNALRALITGPLGMVDTDFVATQPARLAAAYANASPAPVRMTGTYHNPSELGGVDFSPDRALDPTAYPSGGAGTVGTADDFVRFLEAIRRGGAPILDEATVARALANQIGALETRRGPGWGFGWLGAVLTDPARAAVPGRTGAVEWGGAYGHAWRLDRAAELSLVVLTNTSFEGMNGRFPADIKAAVYAALA